MLWLLLGLVAAQPACTGAGTTLLDEGARLARVLALEAAAARYAAAADAGCAEGRVANRYLTGLLAARAAYPAGGSEESLRPVQQADADLDLLARRGDPVAEIARVLLTAAAAASQSERDQMETLLVHATALERRRIAAGAPPLPGVTAHELAGDLWLQVHRFEEARTAYRLAQDVIGPTPRTALGLGRTAERLQDAAGACDAYRSLVRMWDADDTPDITRARTYLGRHCGNPPAPARRRP